MQVLTRIQEILEPLAKKRKYYVIDTTYKREGGRLVLRIILDREGGITMDECAKLNEEISELLNTENLITEQYTLEVSSPGLDRRLKTDKDFKWAVGKRVKINTYGPIEGRSVFSGIMLGLREDSIVVEEDGVSTEIPIDKISKAKLDAQIDWSKK